MKTDRERFLDCFEYQSSDRRPNHELGVWPQTRDRWLKEAPVEAGKLKWNWFVEEPELELDRREFVNVIFGFIPQYEEEVIESTDEYEVIRNSRGIVTRGLKAGTVDGNRMSMDQYIAFPVERPEDFADVKRRLIAGIPERYPEDLDQLVRDWENRDHVLVFGNNCAVNGFYWRAREFMGTENLSLAWYDYPDLMHEMMEFFADFVIETARPVLERIDVEYFTLNEDLSMKNGPLLSPAMYRTFILPHLKRLVEFFRSHGTQYFWIDTDGDPSVLLPQFLEAGVDTIWPCERAAGADPVKWRGEYGKDLRIVGGVDKRVLTQGPEAIRGHLAEFIPLIEEGGFIPTVDHTVPPDVSWDNFRWYMDYKQSLLAGDFDRLR